MIICYIFVNTRTYVVYMYTKYNIDGWEKNVLLDLISPIDYATNPIEAIILLNSLTQRHGLGSLSDKLEWQGTPCS